MGKAWWWGPVEEAVDLMMDQESENKVNTKGYATASRWPNYISLPFLFRFHSLVKEHPQIGERKECVRFKL